MQAIADTGLIVAFGARLDQFHSWAVETLRRVQRPLLTTDVVLAEASYHLDNADLVLEMIETGLLRGALEVGASIPRLRALARQYKDQHPDLADLSIVRLSELYPRHIVLTTDARDFRVYRRNGRERIPILLPPELHSPASSRKMETVLHRRSFVALASIALRSGLTPAISLAVRAGRVEDADALLKRKTASGEVESAALLVRTPNDSFVRGYGLADADTPFLIASITKPMTAAGVMLLRDRGELRLEDRISKFVPAFHGGGREAITIKQVLTHSSGLPDMLPENVELRKRHAPLPEFVEGTCRVPLLFAPGTQVKYQSMGILMASAVAEKITERPFREFLKSSLFAPLGLESVSLGLGGRKVAQSGAMAGIGECARCQVPEVSHYDWNSIYWRTLGAPWGGAHANVSDIAAFLKAFGERNSTLWNPGTAHEMVTVQTAGLNEAWGLGWMRQPGRFGKECSAASWGHWGSTGTVAWHDPEAKLTCVLLTSKPADQSRAGVLGPVSDLVSAIR